MIVIVPFFAGIFGAFLGVVAAAVWASISLVTQAVPLPTEDQVNGLVLGGAALLVIASIVLAVVAIFEEVTS
jgi:drug/metabolite transporter (DMT)-like permease